MQASRSRSIVRSLRRSASQSSTVRPVTRSVLPLLASHPAPHRRTPVASSSRTFFSLPDISKLAGLTFGADTNDPSGIETDGEKQRFHARKILPYNQSQLYSLIADVPSYSSFIPFCTSSSVLSPLSKSAKPATGSETKRTAERGWKPSDQPFDVEAEMCVGFGGLEERYISRVAGRPFESVTATASDKNPLFKSLVTTWAFSPASPLSPHATNPTTSTTARKTDLTPGQTETIEADPKAGPTLLTFDLAFAFVNPLHRIASQTVLPKVADKMVEAFEKRCVDVFGVGRE